MAGIVLPEAHDNTDLLRMNAHLADNASREGIMRDRANAERQQQMAAQFQKDKEFYDRQRDLLTTFQKDPDFKGIVESEMGKHTKTLYDGGYAAAGPAMKRSVERIAAIKGNYESNMRLGSELANEAKKWGISPVMFMAMYKKKFFGGKDPGKLTLDDFPMSEVNPEQVTQEILFEDPSTLWGFNAEERNKYGLNILKDIPVDNVKASVKSGSNRNSHSESLQYTTPIGTHVELDKDGKPQTVVTKVGAGQIFADPKLINYFTNSDVSNSWLDGMYRDKWNLEMSDEEKKKIVEEYSREFIGTKGAQAPRSNYRVEDQARRAYFATKWLEQNLGTKATTSESNTTRVYVGGGSSRSGGSEKEPSLPPNSTPGGAIANVVSGASLSGDVVFRGKEAFLDLSPNFKTVHKAMVNPSTGHLVVINKSTEDGKEVAGSEKTYTGKDVYPAIRQLALAEGMTEDEFKKKIAPHFNTDGTPKRTMSAEMASVWDQRVRDAAGSVKEKATTLIDSISDDFVDKSSFDKDAPATRFKKFGTRAESEGLSSQMQFSVQMKDGPVSGSITKLEKMENKNSAFKYRFKLSGSDQWIGARDLDHLKQILKRGLIIK